MNNRTITALTKDEEEEIWLTFWITFHFKLPYKAVTWQQSQTGCCSMQLLKHRMPGRREKYWHEQKSTTHTRTYWTPYEQNSNMKPNACLPFTYILMSFSQNSVTLKLEPGATRSANSAEDRMSRLAGSSFDSIFTRRNTCWEFELSKKESFNKKSQTFDL